MEQAKHTQGPWFIEDVDDGQAVISAKSKTWIDFARVWVVTDEYPDKEGEANARLIAAAPELLEFAQEWLSRQGGDNNHMTAKARAAIAKATGATQ